MTKLELFSNRCYSWSFYWSSCYSGFFNLVYLSRYLTRILFSLVWGFLGVYWGGSWVGIVQWLNLLLHRIFGVKISQKLKKHICRCSTENLDNKNYFLKSLYELYETSQIIILSHFLSDCIVYNSTCSQYSCYIQDMPLKLTK